MGTATISTLATAKTDLKYTGSYQLLINAAVPTNGKVLYRIKNLNTDTYVAPHNASGTVVTTNRYDDDGVVYHSQWRHYEAGNGYQPSEGEGTYHRRLPHYRGVVDSCYIFLCHDCWFLWSL